jgi:hypothetical protein
MSNDLVLPLPEGRQTAASITVQNASELRQGLRRQALNLRRFARLEAVVRPHIERLKKDIKNLKQLCAEDEAKIGEMEAEIAHCDGEGATEDQADVRQQKINKIIQLEEVYRQLLADKEAYIARAGGENYD